MREDMQEAEKLTVKKNFDTVRWLVKDWNLGPKVAYDNNQKNTSYWNRLAAIWGISTKEARRRSCANCEYGSNDTEILEAMEHIPYNALDKDGGMRVWCDKFDFICHATRVCQKWEED